MKQIFQKKKIKNVKENNNNKKIKKKTKNGKFPVSGSPS